MSSRAQLFLIDGSSQMYRAYHAIRGLSGPDGHSTNAIYGFVTMLRKLLADHEPEFIATAFDLPAPTFRSGLSAEYKATRAPMPIDLAEQVPHVHEACKALGVPIITHPGFEADDVIGTLAAQACERGLTVALVTGDKDFFQLVTPCVLVFNPRDEGTWYDPAGVQAKLGVRPEQVVDVLALMGDTIDNVKGVPGIGEKGARDLISTYGSLDALLAHAAEVPQRKYREALLANADSARQSRELVRLRTDVPITLDLDALRFTGANRGKCFDLFTRMGFRTLTSEYAPTASTVETRYTLVSTRAALESLAREMRRAGGVSLHVLLDPPAGLDARPLGLAFSFRAGEAQWVPVRVITRSDRDGGATDRPEVPPPSEPGTAQRNLFGAAPRAPAPAAHVAVDAIDGNARWPWHVVLEVLGPVLRDPAIAKCAHDWKIAVLALEACGCPLAGLADDTMLASYVLDANRSTHAIEPVALDALGYKAVEAEDVCGKGVKAVGMDTLPGDTLRAYGCERADLVQQLVPAFVEAIATQHLSRVYRELELPLVAVLADIERAGIALDRDVLRDLATRVDRDLEAKQRRIFELAGLEFNINSPKQLAEVLFEKLQLPAPKKTARTKATSTGVEVLEELAQVHEIPREILDWRALAKLKGTYIDALPLLVRPDTGRLHTTFNQAVAATGRLSSSDPNLQNIPIRTGLGREIRRAFVAAPGRLLISADYSQIELRVLAHLSQDENLIEAFTHGEDIHDRTAMRVFGPESGLDPYELRRRAKIINYALLYGKTAFTLAKDIGVSQQAAQAFIDAYFAGFPAVRQFIDDTLARAREQGFVATMWGRRRKLPEITSRNGQVRSAAERIAVNMPIQGSAADILKRAMIDVHGALASDRACAGARMILTVHDELLFEVPERAVDHVARVVRTCMEGAVTLGVPLTVDLGTGRDWMEAK